MFTKPTVVIKQTFASPSSSLQRPIFFIHAQFSSSTLRISFPSFNPVRKFLLFLLLLLFMAEAPASPGGGSHESGGDLSPRSSNVREQDRFLPIANISRIMKKGLPANGKIAKDAKETVQECVSEFISFITSEASDKCQREKRKTVNGDDLLWAMATLGFEDYIEPLKSYLTRYREMEGDTKGSGKGHEGSSKKDGVHPNHSAQLGHQNSYPQGLNYGNSQAQPQHMMVPMQRTE
ncbi:putative transcription factor Hap3/NF-YB family [Helianthus annuus]|nr:putative transcription factor Hap3/NF-YB family [Helianthus annuus]